MPRRIGVKPWNWKIQRIESTLGTPLQTFTSSRLGKGVVEEREDETTDKTVHKAPD